MALILTEKDLTCVHCGLPASPEIEENGKYFCCHGCKTAHAFLGDSLACALPDPKPRNPEEYEHLDLPEVMENWLIARPGNAIQVRFRVPNIQCASCVSVLERLYLRKKGIISSQVNFLKKEVDITFHPDLIRFSEVAKLLDEIGYSPSLADSASDRKKEKYSESTLWTLRMAVAGFCSGNIMLLSFPEYLGLQDSAYQHFFGWLNLALSLPAVFFSGWIYWKSVWLAITKKVMHLDVPIGVGIIATFSLSIYQIITQTGAGYFDSLTGLIFFLLIGKWIQSKTFDFLSFERDFKSYFPLSIVKIEGAEKKAILSTEIKPGDILEIRHGEIIPCDSTLLEGEALLDYSFVSGESTIEKVMPGTRLMAGGRQTGGSIRIAATKEMKRSQLVTLWNNPVFQKENKPGLKTFADAVAYYFTPAVLLLAFSVAMYWAFHDPSKSLYTFVSILIIACPCTLALAYPIALGNTMRIWGKRGFFLKNADVVEKLAQSDTLVFDKTGTLTDQFGVQVKYEGEALTDVEKQALTALFSASTHPLSQAILGFLGENVEKAPQYFKEEKGKGLKGVVDEMEWIAGSAEWVGTKPQAISGSQVYVSLNGAFKGLFLVQSAPLSFVSSLLFRLKNAFHLHLLSGDHAAGQEFWSGLFSKLSGSSHFAQSPENKLSFIQSLQNQEQKVAMIGDGLNDSGALRQAHVGIAVAQNAHQFTPGSDAILIGDQLPYLDRYFMQSKKALLVVRICFAISLVYNVIGLSFAVFGNLQPIVAAILMPASSLSVVLVAWLGTNALVSEEKPKSKPGKAFEKYGKEN
jgi:Cu+-exporting ATPase